MQGYSREGILFYINILILGKPGIECFLCNILFNKKPGITKLSRVLFDMLIIYLFCKEHA